eukprot:GHUV01034008.1.p1 GENE.GHUV01034008.1~~GHUV01034008.1.p1  ORF type:complete len:137 (-),score=13.41 GHUV01034008.1:459-869(-)
MLTRLPTLLQGKLILWRCVFVTHLLVVLVLGSFAWGASEGLSLARRRAEAFTVLVVGELGYALTTIFMKVSTFHPRCGGGAWGVVFSGRSRLAVASTQTVLYYRWLSSWYCCLLFSGAICHSLLGRNAFLATIHGS